MDRQIDASTEVRALPPQVAELFRRDPGCVFPVDDDAEQGSRVHRTTLRVQSDAGTTLAQEITVELGRPVLQDDQVSVPISWRPVSHEHLLPSFAGALAAEPGSSGRTRLTLTGEYHIPLGIVGRFGDAVVGRRIARQSVSALLGDVAARIDEEIDRRRRDTGYVPAPYPVDVRETPRSRRSIG